MESFLVFDVESIGLHGEGFAVGGCELLVDRQSNYWSRNNGFLFACDPDLAKGMPDDRQWVREHIRLKPNAASPREVRDWFWTVWSLHVPMGFRLVSDCGWPVEANFLSACMVDDPTRKGPYPLLDLSSMLLTHGLDPLQSFGRRDDELPEHNPLADARQSARVLGELLTGTLLSGHK